MTANRGQYYDSDWRMCTDVRKTAAFRVHTSPVGIKDVCRQLCSFQVDNIGNYSTPYYLLTRVRRLSHFTRILNHKHFTSKWSLFSGLLCLLFWASPQWFKRSYSEADITRLSEVSQSQVQLSIKPTWPAWQSVHWPVWMMTTALTLWPSDRVNLDSVVNWKTKHPTLLKLYHRDMSIAPIYTLVSRHFFNMLFQ